MGKIFYFMGKSSSGKDTIFQRIQKEFSKMKTIILYTTRPIRENEVHGREYFFVEEDGFLQFQEEGKIIELREYDTMHGVWRYFTVDDGQIDLEEAHYFAIGTLMSYAKMRHYFGEDKLVPIYVEVEAGERLSRALLREKMQETPKYAELCRRFLADEKDFAEENLESEGITRRFENQNIEECVREITLYMCEYI